MPLTRILLTASTLVCLLSSCKKEDYPESGDKLLQRVISDKDTLMSTTFHYDGQNRLIEVIDSNRQGHIWETSIDYNTAGNPVKSTIFYHIESNRVEDATTTDSLVYEDSRVIKKLGSVTNFRGSTGIYVTHTYAYDAKGRLMTDFMGNSNSIDEVYGYTNFTYDGDDNIVKIQEFNKSSGVMDSTRTITVAYNSDKNPYRSIGLMLYFVAGDYLLLGKHNVSKVVYYQYYDYLQRNVELGRQDYTYEYDADGLPKTMILSYSEGGRQLGVSTFSFYYQ
jgi:YD repeat-containing protein